MFENGKRGLGEYKKDHGSDEAYKYYKKNTIEELQVDKKTYRKICDEFNKLFIDEILISSDMFCKFPQIKAFVLFLIVGPTALND